ncbi:membrane protein [Geobacillus genomosp. 3]|uniref:Membrane protein n=1 Tax=Geobacillus genomosp. 3 TaxID=1921421 RepID=S5Z223_GEOG3|nr:YtpI family protein [Geobacillus genomosp. 3]AGT33089.1 membrane protein [Geobacillus genomosp. 3]
MPVLVIFIIFFFSFYVYYKIRYVRAQRPMERQFYSAKSSTALGLFVALFGINQLFLYQTTVTYLISAIFIALGFGSAWAGFRAYRHYLPQAVEEAEKAAKQS